MSNRIHFDVRQQGNVSQLFRNPTWIVTYLLFKALARKHLGDHRYWRKLVLSSRHVLCMARSAKLKPGAVENMAAICAMSGVEDLHKSYFEATGGRLSINAKELADFTFKNPERNRCIEQLDSATNHAIGYFGNSLRVFVKREYGEFKDAADSELRGFIDGLLFAGYATGRRCLHTQSICVEYCKDKDYLEDLTGVLVEYATDLDSKSVTAPWGPDVQRFLSALAKGYSGEGALSRLVDRQQASGLAFMILQRGFAVARAEYDLS